jgi:cysteine-rich repeat protein
MKSKRGIVAACLPSLWLLFLAHVGCSDEARPHAISNSGSSSTQTSGSSSTGSGGRGGAGSPVGGEGSGEGGSGAETDSGGAGSGEAGAPSSVEACGDGDDNDRDGDVDCADPECEESCQSPCSAPETLPDPAEIHASTVGRTNVLSSTCSESADNPGPDSAYRLIAEHTGKLELEIESDSLVHVTVAKSCKPSETQTSCTTDVLGVPVTKGEELFVVVESHSSADAGDFVLRAFTRELDVCGDGYRDPDEPCDDENLDPLDGCSASCELEASETEPNVSVGDANPYEDGFVGSIESAEDEDLILVELPTGKSSITVELLGFGSDCARYALDSALELAAGDALTPLASDDDSGEGFCSRLVEAGLAGGNYYVKVLGSAGAETPFPYRLKVSVNRCGDGILGPGEACDGGNGCTATCELE